MFDDSMSGPRESVRREPIVGVVVGRDSELTTGWIRCNGLMEIEGSTQEGSACFSQFEALVPCMKGCVGVLLSSKTLSHGRSLYFMMKLPLTFSSLLWSFLLELKL
jgi:hypothetical protein